jgi:hypothetical protein
VQFINKFQPVAVPVAVIVCSSITNRCVCYSSVGIGFHRYCSFFVSRGQPFKVYTTGDSVVVDGYSYRSSCCSSTP